jgi:WD40 repeat-containing protein SMU1
MATSLEVGLGTVEIDNADVVRLVLQYLREAGLTSAAAELEKEADVRLNALTNKASLVEDVRKGRWEKALPRLNGLDLPRQASCDLWEHIVRELVSSREPKAAKSVLEGASPLLYLRETDPGRLDALKRLVSRSAEFERLGGQAYSAQDTVDAFPEDSRDVKRRKLSETIDNALGEVAPERLASLLGAALRWRAHTGRSEAGRVDIFRGSAKKAKLEAEKPPRRQAGALRLGEGSRPLCLCFSGDGTALITGSSDGFIEVWDPALCRLRQDLVYQAKDELMLHDAPVLAVQASPDSTALASGCRDGTLKVWRLSTGACARKFAKAQQGAVTCIAWSRDGSQLITGGADGVVRTHGLKSGRQLQQFSHSASGSTCSVGFVSDSTIISAASDGRVTLWDARSASSLQSLTAPEALAKRDRVEVASTSRNVAVVSLLAVEGPKFVVVDRSATAILVDVRSGKVHASYSSSSEPQRALPPEAPRKPTTGGVFVAACCSQPRRDYVYCVTEEGFLYAFATQTGVLERILDLGEACSGLEAHPHLNNVACWGASDVVRLWKH